MDNNDTTTSIFIGLFSVVMFIGIVCFCVFAYFLSGLMVKNYLKINILIIEITRVIIKWILSH